MLQQVKNFNRIILSIGSNVGDRLKNIESSLKQLSKICEIKKISSIYDSAPRIYEDQGNFFNLIIEIDYKNTPNDLLIDIKKIEKLMGRKKTFRYGPRLIDIDIIFFNNIEIKDEELIIPHYDWMNRRFVVEPLSELFQDINLSEYNLSDQKLVKLANINYK
ncbi:MAG: 2-amino-4-hydroxy-6-hydroxymethyldihydropteridine diphosphokinase [Candidatus Actinomarinales bacterium]|nr:MAG: 2-amino-4-hydroxy-6-hydroxymethyldihydropteridine diphosphokinase [Candidatus Actinomarinales bacterium]